ncbi:MAG: hypothetical protein MRY79_03100 [Alphaproteobacteria bacterium]|nr:hypothetical protein [Alphaproteobacteria bacterium]
MKQITKLKIAFGVAVAGVVAAVVGYSAGDMSMMWGSIAVASVGGITSGVIFERMLRKMGRNLKHLS